MYDYQTWQTRYVVVVVVDCVFGMLIGWAGKQTTIHCTVTWIVQ